jgi:FeS assembly SUF system regulator
VIRIAKLTDYAIVLLTHFACTADQAHTARDLAARTSIPLPTVCKVLKALSRGGLLVSQRGVKGGYTLARPAEEISIAGVIAAIDGPIAMTECSVRAPGLCEIEPVCAVRSNWRRINQAVQGALAGLTLGDMTAPLPRQLAPVRTHAASPSTLMARKIS